jgi:hypothetical protein
VRCNAWSRGGRRCGLCTCECECVRVCGVDLIVPFKERCVQCFVKTCWTRCNRPCLCGRMLESREYNDAHINLIRARARTRFATDSKARRTFTAPYAFSDTTRPPTARREVVDSIRCEDGALRRQGELFSQAFFVDRFCLWKCTHTHTNRPQKPNSTGPSSCQRWRSTRTSTSVWRAWPSATRSRTSFSTVRSFRRSTRRPQNLPALWASCSSPRIVHAP